MTPERRAERVRQCVERRRRKMSTDPQYAQKTREQDRLRMRAARAADPEKLAKLRDYMRARRAAHPEIVERDRLRINAQRQADIVKFLLRSARSRSVKFGRDYDLTIEWARERWTGRCELTGMAFDWSRGTIHAFSPSLDRIDSARGYTQDNCRFILQAINAFKGAERDETVFAIARAMLKGERS